MKKISAILLIIIVINFIFGNLSYATSEVGYSKDTYDKLVNEGTVELEGTSKKVGLTQSTLRFY